MKKKRPRKTRKERLFGAAITKLQGERMNMGQLYHEIYLGVLEDLELTEEEVDRYIEAHQQELLDALEEKNNPPSPSPNNNDN